MKSLPLARLFVPTGVLLVLTLLIAGLLTAGIQARLPTPTATATATPTTLPPTPTGTPTATSTSTPTTIPTPTTTPTPTPPPTPLPTPTSTPGPLPVFAEVPILMYHYVEGLPPGADRFRRDLTVTPEDFEAHLQYLANAGYHTITLADLHSHLTLGWALPENPIILTFDDGYRNAYTVAFPLLQEYGFVGTFFVLTSPAHFENPNYLTWPMMAEMADAGMEIEGHGRDHVDLRNRSYDYLVYQILGVREAVEEHTGQPVRFFCYPSGRYDANVIDVLRSAWFWGGVTTRHGRIHTREDLFTLSRIRIRGTDSLDTFIWKVEGDS